MTQTQSFAGKVALVTGAGIGIGYEICRAFAHAGAQVALNDLDGDLAARSAAAINAEIGVEQVIGYGGDVADVPATRRVIAAVADNFGRLDIAVANAGITLGGRFLDYEPEDFDRLLAVNLRGSYFTAQAAARAMIERQIAGRIILMSSVTGVQAFRGLGTYGISKAGIRMMGRSLALELGAYGITVNVIAPGATITERTLQETSDYEGAWAAVIPTGRAAHVADIAAAALFLCSPEARQINGQTLLVDGGWTNISPLPPDY
ncbi:MAG TPA: SDR family oxidoreductase [Phototrophicaceae bacterium]|nr:SDR family oxidoreductase [Phototrophicaceae bacterium]